MFDRAIWRANFRVEFDADLFVFTRIILYELVFASVLNLCNTGLLTRLPRLTRKWGVWLLP